MKVLIINSVCGTGSTGRICTSIADRMKEDGNDVRIAYGRGKSDYPNSIRIGSLLSCAFHLAMTRIFDVHGLCSRIATKRFLKRADEFKPDIVWLHNIHGYYINYELLFEWIKSRPQMQVKWTLHDCWSFTGHCSHYMSIGCDKWKNENGCYACKLKSEYPASVFIDNSRKNFIRKRNAFTGVNSLELIVPSEWLATEVKKSFLREYSIVVEKNEIDRIAFAPTASDFRVRYGLQDKIVILGVASKWNKKKGLQDFIELSRLLSNQYCVVLIGKGLKKVNKSQNENLMTIESTESTNELAKWYTLADVFVNLTYEDNYPTVNLEAEACGTPVITYDTGGCRETVTLPESRIVAQGNIKEIIQAIASGIIGERISKRILVVMRGFFPGVKYGGPPVSVENIVKMMPENEFFIITTDHDFNDKKRYSGIEKGWNEFGNLKNCRILYCKDSEYHIQVFQNAIEEIRPDFVYCQSFFERCVLPLVMITRRKKIPILIAARGELCQGALSIKKMKKLVYIKALKTIHLLDNIHFQATSDEEITAYKKVIGAPLNRIHELTNVLNIGVYDEEVIRMLSSGKVRGKVRMVFYARICVKKNLLYVLELIKNLNADIELDIYGSIEDGRYWEECQKLIRMMPQNIRVRYKGIASHGASETVLMKYDVFILPTLSENFGHSIGEALASGCPVIVSDQTPWNDVENYSAGMAIELCDEERYKEAIMKFVEMNSDELFEYKNNAAKYIREKIDTINIKMKYKEAFEYISGEK